MSSYIPSLFCTLDGVKINGNFTTVKIHNFYTNKPDSNIPEHVNFGAGITRKIVLCPACGWSEENMFQCTADNDRNVGA